MEDSTVSRCTPVLVERRAGGQGAGSIPDVLSARDLSWARPEDNGGCMGECPQIRSLEVVAAVGDPSRAAGRPVSRNRTCGSRDIAAVPRSREDSRFDLEPTRMPRLRSTWVRWIH